MKPRYNCYKEAIDLLNQTINKIAVFPVTGNRLKDDILYHIVCVLAEVQYDLEYLDENQKEQS